MALALHHVFEILQFAASKPSTAREVRGIATHAYKSSLRQMQGQYFEKPNNFNFDAMRTMVDRPPVADVIISPRLASQLDMSTIEELKKQYENWQLLNEDLKLYVYHTRGNTNASVKKKERAEFLDFMAEHPELTVFNAINYERKPYRDSIPDGLGVLELKSRGTENAKEEVNQLMNEVFPV